MTTRNTRLLLRSLLHGLLLPGLLLLAGGALAGAPPAGDPSFALPGALRVTPLPRGARRILLSDGLAATARPSPNTSDWTISYTDNRPTETWRPMSAGGWRILIHGRQARLVTSRDLRGRAWQKLANGSWTRTGRIPLRQSPALTRARLRR